MFRRDVPRQLVITALMVLLLALGRCGGSPIVISDPPEAAADGQPPEKGLNCEARRPAQGRTSLAAPPEPRLVDGPNLSRFSR
jgi:hypothetical protein